MTDLLKDLWKDVNQGADTDAHVREEREEYHLRFSDSPWKSGPGENESPVQKPVNDAWSDLFLELVLATAYANLISNTPIVDVPSAFSFLAFFSLIWWIWASQVVYNIRFRTKDWVHRVFAILQFGVFGAMATFTNNFSIFVGLLSGDSQDGGTPDLGMNTTDFNSVFVSSLREERLPVLNAKGISVVMGFSRLFLFIQYAIVLFYARAENREYRPSLRIHLVSLGISTVAYFATIGVITQHPKTGNDIGKILLWFAPMILEIASHFYTTTMEHVKIEPESIYERSGSLFVVILGEQLNQITGSFKYVIGTVGFTIKGAGLMASTAVIVIGEFSLYARNNWKNWGGHKRRGKTHIEGSTSRTLLWFFSHFLLMAFLILALEAVRSLLSFANLDSALNTMISLIAEISKQTYYGQIKTVTAGMFPEAENAFTALGLRFDDFLVSVNAALQGGITDTAAWTKLAQGLVYAGSVAAYEFDAFPDQGSPIYNEIENFLSDQVVDPHRVYPLIGSFLAIHVNWAFYFWGTAGGTLVMLAILSLLKQNPTDKYETASILTRLVFGLVFISLSGLTANHNQPYYSNGDTAVLNPTIAESWKVASSAWLIPAFAFTLILVNFIEIMLEYRALKKYPLREKTSSDHEHDRPVSEKEVNGRDEEMGLRDHREEES